MRASKASPARIQGSARRAAGSKPRRSRICAALLYAKAAVAEAGRAGGKQRVLCAAARMRPRLRAEAVTTSMTKETISRADGRIPVIPPAPTAACGRCTAALSPPGIRRLFVGRVPGASPRIACTTRTAIARRQRSGSCIEDRLDSRAGCAAAVSGQKDFQSRAGRRGAHGKRRRRSAFKNMRAFVPCSANAGVAARNLSSLSSPSSALLP